jgi:putative ABC transport system permease protein
LLALMVGLFLIYNTMTFSVVRRRPLYGLLRCLGVTRREIISMVLVEALVVGVLGSGLGIALGILMGRQTVHMVTQTINDLYYTTTVQAVGIPPVSLLKGGILGIVATTLTALFPALEASSVPARLALSRSGLERKARHIVFWLAGAGILLIGLGQGFFVIPGSSMFFGFGGTIATLVGFAMESAVALIFLMVLVRPLMGKMLGLLGKMAPSNLVSNLSRTSVAVASLMVAVAVVVGMTLMISSFRSSVEIWLKETLQGDIYISTPSFIQTGSSEAIDPAVIAMVEKEPGVMRVDTLRTVRVDAQQGPVTLNATENPDFGNERLYRQLNIPKNQVWNSMNQGEVLVTEALANRFDLFQQGSQITLMTTKGWQTFPVLGFIYEYTSSEGSIWMADSVYRSYWNDTGQNSISLRLASGVDVNQEVTYLQETLSPIQQLNIRSNVTLRANVMQVFDRTFAITNAMRLLATIVAFIGVLNTSMLLQMEKQRELGILRALGLTKLQLWKLVLLESGLMGLVSGLLAAPTGYVLAVILVDVINKRSFNWTLQLLPTPWVFGQGWIIAIIAAVLAGIYPAWRLNQMAAADAIRYE